MNAKAKSNSVVTTQWQGNVLEITVLGAGQILFDAEKASAANRQAAERHGWTQRLCDRAAKSAPTRQAGISEDQWKAQLAQHTQGKFEAIRELAEYYEKGDVSWRMSGGAGTGDGGLVFQALCELRPNLTRDQVAKFLESRDAKQMATIRQIPELIEIMNRLRMEKAKSVDLGDVLGELDGMDG